MIWHGQFLRRTETAAHLPGSGGVYYSPEDAAIPMADKPDF